MKANPEKNLSPKAFGNDYITTREAAVMLGVTVRTIQNWVDGGKLNARLTLGGHRRLLRNEVAAMVGGSDAQPQPQPQPVAAGPAGVPRLKVLVVEDNAPLLDLYRMRFSLFRVQHELYTAQDGILGMLMVGRYSPHLLLMDLRMPGMDGFQMLRSLQNIPESASMKIVVVTGLSAAEVADRGGLPPGIALLPKPVPFETLEMMCMQRAAELGIEAGASL